MTYKNNRGTVTMHGDSSGAIRILAIEGLGVASNEYITAIYTGQNGQKTLSCRALPRSITLTLEFVGNDINSAARNALKVLSCDGMLYITDNTLNRRIYCNQVQIPDMERILRGKICTFGLQFTCDSPFFEDSNDTAIPLYQRNKLLSSPFVLPGMFGEIIAGGDINIVGDMDVEPYITMYYPVSTVETEHIAIINETTGKGIFLNYAPEDGDIVTIDIKNRKITSSKTGNLLNYLSANTFLGDFVLIQGINRLSIDLGDVAPGFSIECRYNNLYNEAVFV